MGAAIYTLLRSAVIVGFPLLRTIRNKTEVKDPTCKNGTWGTQIRFQ
jgi:hypothetical protein